MATMRFTVRVNRAADDVWKAISTPDTIAEWFPGVVSAETKGNVRTVRGGTEGNIGEVDDIIITNDSDLRRFQYRVDGVEGHLATVDVLEVGAEDTIVTYSVELASEELAQGWKPYMEGGVNGLKSYLESGR